MSVIDQSDTEKKPAGHAGGPESIGVETPESHLDIDLTDGITTRDEVLTVEAGGLAIGGPASEIGVLAEDVEFDSKDDRPSQPEAIDPVLALSRFEDEIGSGEAQESDGGLTENGRRALDFIATTEEPDQELLLGARLTLMSGTKVERTALLIHDLQTTAHQIDVQIEEATDALRAEDDSSSYVSLSSSDERSTEEKVVDANRAALSASLDALLELEPTARESVKQIASIRSTNTEPQKKTMFGNPEIGKYQLADAAASLLLSTADELSTSSAAHLLTRMPIESFSFTKINDELVNSPGAPRQFRALIDAVSTVEDIGLRLQMLSFVHTLERTISGVPIWRQGEDLTESEKGAEERATAIKQDLSESRSQILTSEEADMLGYRPDKDTSTYSAETTLASMQKLQLTPAQLKTLRRMSSRLDGYELGRMLEDFGEERVTAALPKLAKAFDGLTDEELHTLAIAKDQALGFDFTSKSLVVLSEAIVSDDGALKGGLGVEGLAQIIVKYGSREGKFGTSDALRVIEGLRAQGVTIDKLLAVIDRGEQWETGFLELISQTQGVVSKDGSQNQIIRGVQAILDNDKLYELLERNEFFIYHRENSGGKFQRTRALEWMVQYSIDKSANEQSFETMLNTLQSDSLQRLIETYDNPEVVGYILGELFERGIPGYEIDGEPITDEVISQYLDYYLTPVMIGLLKTASEDDIEKRHLGTTDRRILNTIIGLEGYLLSNNFIHDSEKVEALSGALNQQLSDEKNELFSHLLLRGYGNIMQTYESFQEYQRVLVTEGFQKLDKSIQSEFINRWIGSGYQPEVAVAKFNFLNSTGIIDLCNMPALSSADRFDLIYDVYTQYDLTRIEEVAEAMTAGVQNLLRQEGLANVIMGLNESCDFDTQKAILRMLFNTQFSPESITQLQALQKELGFFDFISEGGQGNPHVSLIMRYAMGGEDIVDRAQQIMRLQEELRFFDFVGPDGPGDRFGYVILSALVSAQAPGGEDIVDRAQQIMRLQEELRFFDFVGPDGPGAEFGHGLVRFMASSENLTQAAESILKLDTEVGFFNFINTDGPGYLLKDTIANLVLSSQNPPLEAKRIIDTFDGGLSLWALNFELAQIQIGSVAERGSQVGLNIDVIPTALPLRNLSQDQQEQALPSIQLIRWQDMSLEERRACIAQDRFIPDEQLLAMESIEFTSLDTETRSTLLAYRLFETIVLSRSDAAAQEASERNRSLYESGEFWHLGDLVHGTEIEALSGILHNGLLSGESLGIGSRPDSYPFNLDSVVVSEEVLAGSTHAEKVGNLANSGYGPICLVLRRDSGSLRPGEEFKGGWDDHRLMLGGMPSTEVSHILLRAEDPDLEAEVRRRVVESGIYIPVLNMQGEAVLSPDDFERLRVDENYEQVDVESVDATFKRPDSQKGSNDGAEFIVPLGDGAQEVWYVKFADDNPRHKWNEVLADRLYALVNPELVPETKMVIVEGRVARASLMVSPEEAPLPEDERDRGFILDAWLGNWDAVYNSANILHANGRGLRIDMGNTLFYRAKGELKPDGSFGPEVSEIEFGADKEKLGGGMRQMYPDLTDEEIAKQVVALRENATDDAIDELVDGVRLPKQMREEYKRLLKARRDYIIEYFKELIQ